MENKTPTAIRLSNNIRRVRELRNLSQKDAAKLVDVSQQSYALYEHPEKDLHIKTVEKLAVVFQVPLFTFFLPPGILSSDFLQNLQKSVDNLDDVFNVIEQELYRQKKRLARLREMDMLAIDKSKALFDELLKEMKGV